MAQDEGFPKDDEIVDALTASVRAVVAKAFAAGRVKGRDDALREIAASLGATTPEAHYCAELTRPALTPEPPPVPAQPIAGREGRTIRERVFEVVKPGETWRVHDLAREIGVPYSSLHGTIGVYGRKGQPFLERVARGEYRLVRANGGAH